jgi:hypothetical protein
MLGAMAAPAGGSSDIVAHSLVDGLPPLLGQTTIVDGFRQGIRVAPRA